MERPLSKNEISQLLYEYYLTSKFAKIYMYRNDNPLTPEVRKSITTRLGKTEENPKYPNYECLYNAFEFTMFYIGRKESITEEYYHKMVNVHELFSIITAFSYQCDTDFEFLLGNDEKLNEALSFLEDIFVGDSKCSRFSKKNVVKYIRNALNHNTEKKLYHVSEDGSSISINLEGLKEGPFNVQMDIDDIRSLLYAVSCYAHHYHLYFANPKIIGGKGQAIDFANLASSRTACRKELNKVETGMYYFESKSPYHNAQIVEELKKHPQEFDVVLKSLEDNNENMRKVPFKMTSFQKDYLYHKFQLAKTRFSNMLVRDATGGISEATIIHSMPYGIIKAYDYLFYADLDRKFMHKPATLFIDIKEKCIQDYDNYLDGKVDDDSIFYVIRKGADTLNSSIFYDVMDDDQQDNFNLALYLSYVFSAIAPDVMQETTNIDMRGLRNSFTHGRWSATDGKFYCYDMARNNECPSKARWTKTFTKEQLVNIAGEIEVEHAINHEVVPEGHTFRISRNPRL